MIPCCTLHLNLSCNIRRAHNSLTIANYSVGASLTITQRKWYVNRRFLIDGNILILHRQVMIGIANIYLYSVFLLAAITIKRNVDLNIGRP